MPLFSSLNSCKDSYADFRQVLCPFVKKNCQELKLHLVSATGPDGSKKSGVIVEFSTLSYHMRSPGDMSPDELDEVVDFLMERIETQEKTELFHLENFHKTLERYCYGH